MFNMCSKSFILVLVSVKLFGRFSLVKSIGILSLIIKSNHLIINLNYIVHKNKIKKEEKKLCLKCFFFFFPYHSREKQQNIVQYSYNRPVAKGENQQK